MIREIVTPQNTSFTIELPAEMVGKVIEIIAFEINGEKLPFNKEQRLKEINEFTESSLVDLSNFKFNRDEANHYEE